MTTKRNAFRVWLDSGAATQKDVWKALDVTPSMASGWATGRVRPTLAHALAIEQLSGGKVPVSSWLPEDEMPHHEPLEAR